MARLGHGVPGAEGPGAGAQVTEGDDASRHRQGHRDEHHEEDGQEDPPLKTADAEEGHG